MALVDGAATTGQQGAAVVPDEGFGGTYASALMQHFAFDVQFAKARGVMKIRM
ncbi:hypothetical protein D3C75_1102070 [compost metagenome]